MEPSNDTKATTSSQAEQSTSAEPELSDVIKRLAGLVGECPVRNQYYEGVHDFMNGTVHPCAKCEGTGTVECFKSLRRECNMPAPHRGDPNDIGRKHLRNCPGWLPVAPDDVDLGALLVWAEINLKGVILQGAYGHGWHLEIDGFVHTDDYETPTEAVLRAIHATLQTETPPVPNDLPQSPN